MPDSRRKGLPPGVLTRLDGRVKILLLLLACFASQYLPLAWLAGWVVFLACLIATPDVRRGQVGAMLRAGVVYILFWLAMTIGSDVALGGTWTQALAGAVPLGLRLLALTLTGIVYMGVSMPLETGRAVSWFLFPFFGERAWKPALLVALTAWYLPLTLRLAGQVRAGMRARGLALPRYRRAFLMVGASLRILERTASELSVGLASRRLDDWRSWR